MKKILSAIILVSLCTPGIALAVWWNPTTWFKKKNTPVHIQEDVIAPPSTKTTTMQSASPVASTTQELVDQALVSTSRVASVVTESKNNTGCIVLTKELIIGQTDPEVTMLQQFLAKNGYLNGKPNGTIGEGTFLAIKKLQFDNGLSQSGKADSETRKVIKDISCGSKIASAKNPIEKLMNDQTASIASIIPTMCTKSMPIKMNIVLTKYISETTEKISNLQALHLELKKDPRYNKKMEESLVAIIDSHENAKKCASTYNRVVSLADNTTVFDNASCAMVKNCMSEIVRTTELSTVFVSLLWDIFTPKEKQEFLSIISSQIR